MHFDDINIIIFMEIYGEFCKFMVGYNKNTKHTKEEFEMKKVKILMATLAISTLTTFPSFAEWKQEADGRWWYQNVDGTWLANQWQEIGGKQYYFGADGYMLENTTTPDGYFVGADGAWIENNSQSVPTILNVEGLNPQQNGYIVTYQYFNTFKGYYKTQYQAIIEIQNTSTGNLYLGNATFDIYDRSGNIVASETFISSDPNVIAPGQKGYFYSNGGYLDNVSMGDYVMHPTINVEPTSLPVIRYPVSGTSIKESRYGGVNIVGTVTNNTTQDEGLLWIVFVLYGDNDIPIGVCGTNILDFNAGITKGFESNGGFLPDYITLDKIKRYEVIAAPAQYQF